MKMIRAFVRLVLFTIILMSFAPVSASAEDALLPEALTSSEAGTETVIETQGSISDLVFTGNTASVTYQTNVSATIVVAVYDETTGEMIASGNINAAPDEASQTASIQMNLSAEEMPANFYAKAFLIDRHTHFPLGDPFATERYTTTVQSLLSDSLSNYSDQPSIDFGNGNYVAFTDDVTVIDTSSAQNKVTHQADGSWLFENPDATLQSLSNGNTVSFTDPDGIVQLGTVSSISDAGNIGKGMRLEITPDPDRPSKIAALKFSAKYTGNPDHGNAFSYLKALNCQTGNMTFSAGLSGKAGIIEGEISGGFNLEYKHQPDITCIIAWKKGNSYIDVSYASENQLAVEAEGKGSLSITPFSLPLPTEELIDITVGPKFILELSSGVEWDRAWSHAFHYTIVNGDISPANETPQFHPNDSSVKLNGEFSFSFFGGLDISALDGDLLKTTIGAEMKAFVSGEKTPYVPETSDGAYHHLCEDCINGQIGISVSGKTEVNLWNSENMSMKFSHDTEIWSPEPISFYTCNTHGEHEINKSCPYYTWRVRLQMLDAEETALPNVDVINAANHQPIGKTDGSGYITSYLPDGEYDFYVPYGSKKQFHVRVNHEPQYLVCKTDIIKGSCGVNLNYEVLGNTLYITGSGSMYDYSSKTAPWYQYADRISEVVFPDELTSIGAYAFYKMNKLTRVIIPDKVEIIGASAFQKCENLEGVDLPEELKTVKSYAFDNCIRMTDILVFPEKNDITIQSYAFNRLIKMHEPLYFPKNVVRIGDFAFQSYGEFADSTVGTLHFSSEESRLTQIGRCAFDSSCFMDSVEIPDSVTYIEAMAFQNMKNASGTLTLSAGLTSIEDGTFAGSAFSGALQIPDAVKTIDGSAFAGCRNLTSVKLNDGLTHIFDNAFKSCEGFKGTLTIPASVTYLGTGAFGSCTKISRIVMENGTAPKTIGSTCFEGSSKGTALTEVILADTVTTIGGDAFSYHAGLTTISLPDSVKEIGFHAFVRTGLAGKLELPASLITIGQGAFEDLTALTEIEFPDQLELIDQYAFKGCTGLSWLSLPDSLKEIGLEAFGDCIGLTGTLILPDHITKIGIRAFMTTNFTDIVMPAGLADYGSGMFVDNQSLERIFIKGAPDNIYVISRWIGDYTGTVYYPQDSSFWASEEAQLKCNSTDGKTVNAVWVPFTPGPGASWGIDITPVAGDDTESQNPIDGSRNAEAADSSAVPSEATDSASDSSGRTYSGPENAEDTYSGSDKTEDTYSGSDAAVGSDTADDTYSASDNTDGSTSAPADETSPVSAPAEGTSPASAPSNETNPASDPSNAADPSANETRNNDTAGSDSSITADGTAQEEQQPFGRTMHIINEEQQSFVQAIEIVSADETSAEKPAGKLKQIRLKGVFASYTPASANTAAFTDRWPGQAYLFVIVRDKNADDLLAPDNLLFIDQKQADSSGALTFGYTLPASAGDCEQLLCGTECIPLRNAKVTASDTTYSGSALTPTVTVKFNNIKLTEGLHYTVAYKDNVLPGTATITVSGIAPYYGTATGTFTIQKKAPVFSASGFTVSSSDKPQSKKLDVTVTEGGPVSYSTTSSQITVDQSGMVTIPANFVGSGTIKVTCAETAYYTSKTVSVTVRSTKSQDPSSGGTNSGQPGDSENQNGSGDTGSSGSSAAAGTTGSTSGSSVGNPSENSTDDSFVTVQWLKAPKLKSLKNTASRKLTVKWKKNKKATGYEIQYARKKDFSDAKSKWIRKPSKTKLVLKKLKKGKKYYVRIRSYKDIGKIRYYSEFGKVKKVKIRK